MKLELEVIDGPQKSKRISLRNGLQIGQSVGPLEFEDSLLGAPHAVIYFDHKNAWNIECLGENKIRLGLGEIARASLIHGLIFHLGQTGFKVVEKNKMAYGLWDEGLKQWLLENSGQSFKSELFFFLSPIRLKFIQGSQFEEFYTLSYGPRELGFNNLDLLIKDSQAPAFVARFFQISEQSYIESLCGDKVKINGASFNQHPIANGDRLSIASTVIELSILK